jgi:hypothetical protein
VLGAHPMMFFMNNEAKTKDEGRFGKHHYYHREGVFINQG